MHLTQFQARLKSLRLLQGLTQSELAERADISTEHVSKLERGGSAPSFKTICALAQALEIAPSSLFLLDPPAKKGDRADARNVGTPGLSPSITHMGSLELDLTSNVFFYSRDMRRLVGIDPDENIMTPREMIRRFGHPDDLNRLLRVLKDIRKGKGVSRLEFRFLRTDGQVRQGLLHCEVEMDGSGKPRLARAVCLDVTEINRLETLLRKSRVNQEDKVRNRPTRSDNEMDFIGRGELVPN